MIPQFALKFCRKENGLEDVQKDEKVLGTSKGRPKKLVKSRWELRKKIRGKCLILMFLVSSRAWSFTSQTRRLRRRVEIEKQDYKKETLIFKKYLKTRFKKMSIMGQERGDGN